MSLPKIFLSNRLGLKKHILFHQK